MSLIKVKEIDCPLCREKMMVQDGQAALLFDINPEKQVKNLNRCPSCGYEIPYGKIDYIDTKGGKTVFFIFISILLAVIAVLSVLFYLSVIKN